jgi:lactoylglutathione lyase
MVSSARSRSTPVSEVVAAAQAPAASESTTEPIPIAGLFETHLTVSDLGRSVAFYRSVVGLPLALEVPERGAAFFWIAEPGEAMLGLWSLGSAPLALSLHVAFKASVEDVLGAPERLRSLGVRPLSFFAEETTEPSVIGWMPAAAVYFRDPDGHLLEYLAMLDEVPNPEAGVVSWSEWAARKGPLHSDPAAVRTERHPDPHSEPGTACAGTEGSVARLEAYRGARQRRRVRAPGVARRR